MPTKCVMLFDGGDQDGGWSEVYYLNSSDTLTAVRALDALAPIRALILSPDNAISGFRVTQPLTPPEPGFIRSQRRAYFTQRSIPGAASGSTGGASDVLWTGVMVRLTNDTLTIFKNQIYRGIPDSYWSNKSDAQARAVMGTWIGQWQAALRSASAQIRHNTRTGPPSFPGIQFAQYERIVRRATGRAFDVLRGRK